MWGRRCRTTGHTIVMMIILLFISAINRFDASSSQSSRNRCHFQTLAFTAITTTTTYTTSTSNSIQQRNSKRRRQSDGNMITLPQQHVWTTGIHTGTQISYHPQPRMTRRMGWLNDDDENASRIEPTETTSTTAIITSRDDDSIRNDAIEIVSQQMAANPTMTPDTTTATTTPEIPSDAPPSIVSLLLDSYWGSRIVLLICAAIYSTNFALGTLMNEALPPSAVTACRMTFAALTLLPFLLQIQVSLLPRAILTGMCAALGYVTQSMALSDTDPARVSFLGAATVLWLPILESTIDHVPMSIRDAPQTWMAAVLCLVGVGILELYDPAAATATAVTSGIHTGDVLALVQAIGFGTGAYLSSKLVREQPDQVLSITSVLIATTAILSWIWCILVGSTSSLMTLLQSDPIHTNLPLVFSILWTGIISTSINYVIEIAALGRVPPAEASVLLASEPIWAAVFAAVVIGNTSLGVNDYIGGSCIVAACLVNALLKPQDILNIFSNNSKNHKDN